jgi:hypothetical protein
MTKVSIGNRKFARDPNTVRPDLENDLGKYFSLLIVKQNMPAPGIIRPPSNGELFRLCLDLVKDTKRTAMASPQYTHKEMDSLIGDHVPQFSKAFVTCYKCEVSFPPLEQLMKNPLFDMHLKFTSYYQVVYKRMKYVGILLSGFTKLTPCSCCP